jgi:diguanylate cyclase (GGDEF)-like protein
MHINERRRGAASTRQWGPSPESMPLTAEWLILLSLTLKIVGFCAICALVLNVGLSADGINARCHQEVFYFGLLGGGLYCAAIALALCLMRELRRRKSAERQLMLLANTDSLTGLANRRRFDEALECEWTQAISEGTSLALLMIDADWFKLYNDAHGHQAGDSLLQAVSRCIATGTRRASDFAARYGGEEFAVLLPDIDAEAAFTVAERIRAKVVDLGLKHPTSPLGIATVSIGVSCLAPADASDARGLVSAADRALYQAKRLGRHRTEFAEPSCVPASASLPQPAAAPQLRLVS